MAYSPEINAIGSFLFNVLVPYAPTTMVGNMHFSDEFPVVRKKDVAAAAIIDHLRWQILTQDLNPAAAAVYIIAGALEAATLFYLGGHPNSPKATK